MDFAGHQAAAEGREAKAARFLADEADDLQRRADWNFILADGAHRLERADDAHRAVILAAMNHRVEMGARQHRRRFCIAAFEPAEDVADGVDVDFQSGLAHQVDQYLPAAQFFDGKYQTRHTAAVADADAADGVQVAHETALVDGGQGGWTVCRGQALHSQPL